MSIRELLESGRHEEVKEWFQIRWIGSTDGISSHERVTMALNRKEPDRVPFDFWVVPENWVKLMNYFVLKEKDDLLDLLGVDCRIIRPDYIGPELQKNDDGSFYNVWGSVRKIVRNEYSEYEEYASFPLADAETVSEVESWEKWPRAEYWDWKSLIPAAEKANRREKRYIRYDIGGIFESAWALYGLDNFLMALYEKPEIVQAIMNCYTEIFIANFRSAMESAGDIIDMVYTYDDVAVQDGLLMSPEMWREYILPFHQKLNKVIREYDVKLIYHSCGSVLPLVDAFRDDMGIDVLNPLQPAAKGMDMSYIKKTWGDSLSFHGGGDLQRTLPFGTKEEVQDEVDMLCRTLGPGGGYICTSAHYIQADVPLKNILAFYATDRSCR
ncbi:MAG: uroporphyrinogen decarboxylase family protein [Spirochaetales bacterium]|nr:uroporphyrinogen decarboxylase family protein [Spirochaetales bacterium]